MCGSGCRVGCCTHPVTVYIRGHIQGSIYIYNDTINIIQLLQSGGSTPNEGPFLTENPGTPGGK